jgi:hypothetical protein
LLSIALPAAPVARISIDLYHGVPERELGNTDSTPKVILVTRLHPAEFFARSPERHHSVESPTRRGHARTIGAAWSPFLSHRNTHAGVPARATPAAVESSAVLAVAEVISGLGVRLI